MTALGIDCSDREPKTWFDQRPSHHIQYKICLSCNGKGGEGIDISDYVQCPQCEGTGTISNNDPRSELERDLDWLAKDEAATIRSIRPGG
jgi:hypothetical protein